MRSSRWLVALIVSGVILLAGAPGAMAAGWRPPVDISSPQTAGADPGCSFICFGNYPGAAGVDIAVNARGDAMAAWIRRTGSGTAALQTAFRPAGGSFGAPQTVGPSQGLYFFGFLGPLADVAMDNQGNAVVVWPATKNGRTVVESSVRPAGGNFGAPVDLTADDLSANTDPRVAISPGTNEAVAVWTRSNGSKTVVQSSTKPVGGAFAPAINLSDASLNSSAARIALNPSGAAAVTWLQSDGSNNLVRARTRPAGGVFAATQTLSAAGRDATEPDVAIDDAGRATVVWSRYDGTQTRVQSRFLTAAGGIGAGIDDVSNNARDALSPRVALDSENTAVAVWRACDTGTSSGCVVESATRPSGGSFGSVDAVGPPSDSSFTLPRVAMDPGGTATAVWSDFGGARIRTSRRPRNGSFGSVDEISPATGQALEPAVSTDNEGSAVAAWAYTRPDGNQVAQAAVFDAGAPALSNVNVPATLTTGVPADMSATATDRWSGVSFTWDFGDGATASGGGVSHAYGAPGVYTAVVRATDAAGNSSSVSRTIQVSNPTPPPPPPPPAAPKRIVVTMPFFVKKSTKKYTVFTQLDVKGIPSGSTLKVTCKAPKGKKCPAKSYTKRNAKGKVSLKKWLKKRLPAGAKLTATVTKTGNFIGAVKIMTVKKRARPSFVDRCLPPGAKKPAKC